MDRRQFALRALSVAALTTSWSAYAQNKPLRLLVGFPAGGSSDVLARLLAEAMRGKVNGPIIVDNRAGAGGRLAAEVLKSADADGSTVLITPNPVLTIYPHLYKRLAYDPLKDLQPIARVATYPLLISIGPMVPANVKTLTDFIGWLKANPGKGFFGSPGAGSTPHFVGQMLGKSAKVELSHVSYRGDAPAIQDMLGGQIAMCINTPAAQLPHLPSGRLRILASTGPKRMAQLPDVPTLSELGYDIKTADWYGAFVPAATPAEITLRLQRTLADALETRDVKEGLNKLQVDVAYLPGSEFRPLIKQELDYWGPIVRASGFTVEE